MFPTGFHLSSIGALHPLLCSIRALFKLHLVHTRHSEQVGEKHWHPPFGLEGTVSFSEASKRAVAMVPGWR
ncbi:hypothetical protein CPC08DRAFT_381602 [Agrocybe pediades]|nr:hypothetical protein CPC08DRAFT_381602 [Agrocybe pediades]